MAMMLRVRTAWDGIVVFACNHTSFTMFNAAGSTWLRGVHDDGSKREAVVHPDDVERVREMLGL